MDVVYLSILGMLWLLIAGLAMGCERLHTAADQQ